MNDILKAMKLADETVEKLSENPEFDIKEMSMFHSAEYLKEVEDILASENYPMPRSIFPGTDTNPTPEQTAQEIIRIYKKIESLNSIT